MLSGIEVKGTEGRCAEESMTKVEVEAWRKREGERRGHGIISSTAESLHYIYIYNVHVVNMFSEKTGKHVVNSF